MKNLSFDSLDGLVCVITGGAGVIGSSMAKGLASVGVKTAILADTFCIHGDNPRAIEVVKYLSKELLKLNIKID